MYTQISIKNYIMHESLFLEVIGGHMRSKTVKHWFKLNAWKFAPQSYLSYNNYKVISLGVIGKVLLRNKISETNENIFLTVCDLIWPRGTNIHALCHFLWKSEYTCKKLGLGVMFLIFYLWWPFSDLLWPFMTKECEFI